MDGRDSSAFKKNPIANPTTIGRRAEERKEASDFSSEEPRGSLEQDKAVDQTILSNNEVYNFSENRFSIGSRVSIGGSKRDSIGSEYFHTPLTSPQEKNSEEELIEEKPEEEKLFPFPQRQAPSFIPNTLKPDGTFQAGTELQQELTKKIQEYLLKKFQEEEQLKSSSNLKNKTLGANNNLLIFAITKLVNQQEWTPEEKKFWDADEIFQALREDQEKALFSETQLLFSRLSATSAPAPRSFPRLRAASQQEISWSSEENNSSIDELPHLLTITRTTFYPVENSSSDHIKKSSTYVFRWNLNESFQADQVISKYNFPYIIQCRHYETGSTPVTKSEPPQQLPPQSCLIQ